MQQINQALNSWLSEVVTGYHIKINLATSVSVPLFALGLQSEPPETLETANICMSMSSFPLSRILSQIPYMPLLMRLTLTVWVMVQIDNGLEMSLAKQYFDDWLVSIKQQDHSFSGTEKKKFKSQHTLEGLFNY